MLEQIAATHRQAAGDESAAPLASDGNLVGVPLHRVEFDDALKQPGMSAIDHAIRTLRGCAHSAYNRVAN